MPAQWVSIEVDGQTMEGYQARPSASGPHPTVVVVQEIFGVNSHIQAVANRLASQGYVALAPALYHRLGPMTLILNEEREVGHELARKCTDAGLIADVKAAVEFLKSQSYVRGDRIGLVGFCFGGRVAYLSACNIPGLKATADFYGGGCLQARGEGPAPIEQTVNITAPLLGIFGEEDQGPSPDDVKQIEAELKRHGKTYEFHSYPGAGHGFHNDERDIHRPEAARDAWAKTLAWFERYLKG